MLKSGHRSLYINFTASHLFKVRQGFLTNRILCVKMRAMCSVFCKSIIYTHAAPTVGIDSQQKKM